MRFLLACFSLLLLPAVVSAQIAAPACGAPPAILKSTQPNIFTEQQEQWLGDAQADMLDRSNRPVKDPQQSAYLEAIGARLLAALPPTSIQFHFVLVDSSEINAYSMAGGRVYVNRKLVANARSEDEVAAVMAHEMGHILTHQFVYDITADLKRLLGVASVGDRADIYTQYQRLTDARMRDKHAKDNESDEKQDQADRVSVYATAAAGYRPQAYSEFWDRSFFVGGKTGSGLSDLFGLTKPHEKRLRLIRKMVADLPPGCGADKNAQTEAFNKWHQEVIANQAATEAPHETAETTSVALTPPLRLDVERMRFSRDGKYLLAQDESSVSVLSREPLKTLFRFDADRAEAAQFTPDSTGIVFHTTGLHVEHWSVADQKLVSAHEVVAPAKCLESILAPDGRTIVCMSFNWGKYEMDLSLLDVESGKAVYEKKGWFEPNYYYIVGLVNREEYGTSARTLPRALSSDGNMLIFGSGDDKLAFDLRTRTPIKLSGAFQSQVSTVYAFQGDTRVLGMDQRQPRTSIFYSFPDGRRISEAKVPVAYAQAITHGDYFLVPPPVGFVTAVADVMTGKYIGASKITALDMFGDTIATQDGDGTVMLYKPELHDATAAVKTTLPLSPLGSARAVAISPDGHYLALSSRYRSGVWDMTTGVQVVRARDFAGAAYSAEGKLLVEFAKLDKLEHKVTELDLATKGFMAGKYKLEDNQHLFCGRLLEWKPDGKKAVTLAARSILDNTPQWTRSFPDGQPGYSYNLTDGDLVFSYATQASPARDKIKLDPALRDQAALIKFKDAGRLIEFVDPATGVMRMQVVVEVPVTYYGVGGFTRVGDLLYLSVDDNRTIVYSFKTGAQLRQIFGTLVAADPASERIAAANRRGEVVLYDRAGAELQHLNLGQPIRFGALLNKGTQLTVLTADQKIRRFTVDVPPQRIATHSSLDRTDK